MTSITAHVRQASGNLLASGQRTLLALLGIVVGIGAVIALLTTGAMAKSEAVRQFESLGTDMLSVFDITRRTSVSTPQDVLRSSHAPELAGLATIAAASPYTLRSAELVLDGRKLRSVQLIGVTSAFADLHDARAAEGRFISTFDGRRPFAAVGAGVAREAEGGPNSVRVGTLLRLDQAGVFTVVGVLQGGVQGPPGTRPDGSVFIPIGLAERATASKEITGITLRIEPGVHYLTAAAEVVEHFRLNAPTMDVRVDSPVRVIEQMEAQMRLFTLLLGAVGGISLVVGGFGVMNAMLASVAERREEIGIRRAIGARRADIQHQFLAESSLLCAVGGVLGAVLGVAASVVIGVFAEWTWKLSPGAIILGIATACAVGVFFGYHPARQAAHLDPITAMRDG